MYIHMYISNLAVKCIALWGEKLQQVLHVCRCYLCPSLSSPNISCFGSWLNLSAFLFPCNYVAHKYCLQMSASLEVSCCDYSSRECGKTCKRKRWTWQLHTRATNIINEVNHSPKMNIVMCTYTCTQNHVLTRQKIDACICNFYQSEGAAIAAIDFGKSCQHEVCAHGRICKEQSQLTK